MTASLTPALALAYLRELSTDIRAAVVLDAGGEPLVGERALAERARRLLARDGEPQSEPAGDGILLAARGDDGLAIAVEAGPHALTSLLLYDMRRVLADLAADAR